MLWQSIETIFKEYPLQKTQEEKNTLSCNIDSDVRLSFFGYHYPLIEPTICEEGLFIATPLDIGYMKLSAITSRATLKDYVDLYFILKKYPLEQLLQACDHKYPSLDKGLILKSLVYFDDISVEPIRFMPGFETDINTIQKYLFEVVKNYWKNYMLLPSMLFDIELLSDGEEVAHGKVQGD
jgi:hypothetical protein